MIVTSWNIKGKDNALKVWIRFKTNMDSNTCDNITDIAYRKLSPSQQRHNLDRAKEWKNRNKYDVCSGVTDKGVQHDNNTLEIDPNTSSTECAFKEECSTEEQVEEIDIVNPTTLSTAGQEESADTGFSTVAVAAAEPLQVQETRGHSMNGCQGNATDFTRCKQQNTDSKRQLRSRNKRRSFYYKHVPVPLKCCHCADDFVVNTPSKSFLCTYCPAFVCKHCVKNGYHDHHKSTLKGPASLDSFYSRYC